MKKYIFAIFLIFICVFTGCKSEKHPPSEQNSSNFTYEDEDINNKSKVEDIADEKSKNEELENKDAEIVEIKEKMFLTQINDIYYNFDDYNGKIIKVEGMYSTFDFDESEKGHMVYRNGPGCCGNDGWGGFLLNYDGEYPEDNDWIEVIGTPEIIEKGDFRDLYLNVTSLTVLEERGAEFVYQ